LRYGNINMFWNWKSTWLNFLSIVFSVTSIQTTKKCYSRWLAIVFDSNLPATKLFQVMTKMSFFLEKYEKCQKSRKCFKNHKNTSKVSKTSWSLILVMPVPKNVIWQKIEKSGKNDKSDDLWVTFEKNQRRVRRSLWRPPLFWGGPASFLDNYQYIVMTRRAYTCAL